VIFHALQPGSNRGPFHRIGYERWWPLQLTSKSTGRTTSFGYTSSGLLNSTTDALNHTGSATYNSNGTVASQIDENGHTTHYSYVTSGNGIGLPSRVDYPALSGQSSPLGSDTYSYDSANRVYQHTDGKAQVTTIWYDSLDRTTRLGYSRFAGGPSQTFNYDAEGELLSTSQGGGGQPFAATTYSYDAAGQPTSTTLPSGPYLGDGQSIDYYCSMDRSTYEFGNKLLRLTASRFRVMTYSRHRGGEVAHARYCTGVGNSRRNRRHPGRTLCLEGPIGCRGLQRTE